MIVITGTALSFVTGKVIGMFPNALALLAYVLSTTVASLGIAVWIRRRLGGGRPGSS